MIRTQKFNQSRKYGIIGADQKWGSAAAKTQRLLWKLTGDNSLWEQAGDLTAVKGGEAASAPSTRQSYSYPSSYYDYTSCGVYIPCETEKSQMPVVLLWPGWGLREFMPEIGIDYGFRHKWCLDNYHKNLPQSVITDDCTRPSLDYDYGR
jgi:hypothetical protein